LSAYKIVLSVRLYAHKNSRTAKTDFHEICNLGFSRDDAEKFELNLPFDKYMDALREAMQIFLRKY
jgi:hypothetical protein